MYTDVQKNAVCARMHIQHGHVKFRKQRYNTEIKSNEGIRLFDSIIFVLKFYHKKTTSHNAYCEYVVYLVESSRNVTMDAARRLRSSDEAA